MFAAGELAMTPHDLALWDESLIARVDSEARKLQRNVHRGEAEGRQWDALRTWRGSDRAQRPSRSIEHSGEVTGFVSDNEVLIDDGVAVAVLTNHMASGAEEIAQLCARTVAGNPRSNRPRRSRRSRNLSATAEGQIDRSLLAPNLNDYFSAQTMADFKSSLAPLGEPPIFHMTRESLARRHDVSRRSRSCIRQESCG